MGIVSLGHIAQIAAELFPKADRVYLCGNGGSAANANHIANDLVSAGVRAQSLTSDVATLTMIANDYSYAEVFSRQLECQHVPGSDAWLVLLSGSGDSENIVKAAEEGSHLGLSVLLITGTFYHCQRAEPFVDYVLPFGADMQQAEEYQLKFGHEVMRRIKQLEGGVA